MLPRTLGEAVEALARDPLAQSVLGDAMFKAFITYKREELESYHSAVSEWEQQRYLEFF